VRPGLALGLLLMQGLLLGATPARAHGSFPEAKQILLPADRPAQIILATNFGLIFSEDSGGTWLFSCEHGLSAYAAPYLLGTASSRRIFALTSGGVVYSDDDACGWQTARGTSDLLPYAFAVDPSSSKRLYVIGVPLSNLYDGDNIYVSDDGGLSFGQPVFTSSKGSALLSVMVAPGKPSVVFASLYSTPENHPILLRSDDSGEHWDAAADLAESLGDNPFELLAIDPLDENKLYVRILEASAETLAISDDGGHSFATSVSIPGKLSAFLKLASGTILVGGSAGTDAVGYRSKDGGQHFEAWPAAPRVHALAEREGKLYVAADDFADGYAIAESDDEGEHLKPLGGFKQVQAVQSCVADVCAESCAYYAGTGLWSAATCGAVATPADAEPAGSGGDTGAAGAASTGADTASGGEAAGPSPEAGSDAGAPSLNAVDERLSLRVSGFSCACKISGARRAPDWAALLLAGGILAARRRARRPMPRPRAASKTPPRRLPV
jgi:hypothetical protein